jgi:hypothetical protein
MRFIFFLLLSVIHFNAVCQDTLSKKQFEKIRTKDHFPIYVDSLNHEYGSNREEAESLDVMLSQIIFDKSKNKLTIYGCTYWIHIPVRAQVYLGKTKGRTIYDIRELNGYYINQVDAQKISDLKPEEFCIEFNYDKSDKLFFEYTNTHLVEYDIGKLLIQ